MLKVKSVKYSRDHMLSVELSDGSSGLFDVTPYLDKERARNKFPFLRRIAVCYQGIKTGA